MRQIRALLDLVVNYIFLPTDTQYYLMKVEVTVLGNALMRTGTAQLDDDSKVITAGERDARNIHSTITRLVGLVSFIEKSWSTRFDIVRPTIARLAIILILILFLSSDIGFVSCFSGTSLLIESKVHLLQLRISWEWV